MVDCKYRQGDLCLLLTKEVDPVGYHVTDLWCKDRCGPAEKQKNGLVKWALSKRVNVRTPQELYRRECQRICNECEPKVFCQLKNNWQCKRGKPGYFCKEDKWPEFPMADKPPQAEPGIG